MSFEETPTQKMRAARALETPRDGVTELLLVAPEHLSALVKAVRLASDSVARVEQRVSEHHALVTGRMSSLEESVQRRLSVDASLLRSAKALGLVVSGAVIEAATSGRLAEAARKVVEALGGG